MKLLLQENDSEKVMFLHNLCDIVKSDQCSKREMITKSTSYKEMPRQISIKNLLTSIQYIDWFSLV
jgi:hypothetical protein